MGWDAGDIVATMSVTSPDSLDAALAALADNPAAHVLAGGTDMMVELNFGRRSPAPVVSVGRIPELRGIDVDRSARFVRLGAAVTFSEFLASEAASQAPALAQAARTVGSLQIRNAGTFGGNLATCSPAGDTLPVLVALSATVELASRDGRRRVPVEEFMVGPKRSALKHGEIVAGVTLPIIDGWQGFAKVGTRNAMVIAVCNAALVVDRHDRSVRLAMGSVGPTILRAPEAESVAARMLFGAEPTSARADLLVEFERRASAAVSPIDDQRSTADYRRHAVGVIARRLLDRASREMP